MTSAHRIRIYLVVFTILFGSLVGVLTARVPAFSSLGMPSFLWLVAGLFAFEMFAGLLLDAHPATLLSMPWRAAGLALSFVSCYAAIAVMT
jgi:hypothetical protein